jgi:hypothetical protein
MKNTIKLTLSAIALCFAAQAQEVIIIDKGDAKERKEREIKLNDNTQVVKFAPLNMLVGEINLGYERQLSQKGSIDLEVGPTISKIGVTVDGHLVDPYTPSIAENSGLGFFTTVGYRFYPLDATEALNRFYVSPVMKFKVMNHTISDLSNMLDDVRASNTRLNFYFNFGYQIWMAKSFSMDFFGGFGIGYQSIKDYLPESVFVDNNWTYRWASNSRSGAVYVGNVGLKLGIGSK